VMTRRSTGTAQPRQGPAWPDGCRSGPEGRLAARARSWCGSWPTRAVAAGLQVCFGNAVAQYPLRDSVDILLVGDAPLTPQRTASTRLPSVLSAWRAAEMRKPGPGP